MTIIGHEFIDLPTPTGPMRTCVFRPAAAGRYPGILLFSEIFQVTGPIRRTAALLAGHGFVLAVPEIYHEFNGQHAFLRDEGPRYDPELALKSYGLALELFKRKLGEGDLSAIPTAGPAESRH